MTDFLKLFACSYNISSCLFQLAKLHLPPTPTSFQAITQSVTTDNI